MKRSRSRRRTRRTRRASRTTVARRNPVRRRRRSRASAAPARRIRRSRRSVVRSVRRRSRRSRGGNLSLRSLFDRQTLTLAGGAVASGFLTNLVVSKFRDTLPGATNPYGQIAYNLAIPFAGALAVRKFSPDLAKGMLLGGVIAAMQNGLTLVTPSLSRTVTPTGEYLDSIRPVGALPPGYAAVDTFGANVYGSEPAFAGDAWGQ